MNKIYTFLLFLVSTVANSATYYVSPTGVDTNAGSLAAPFKTISKGLSKVVAGDTVLVRGGTYVETVNLSKAGTATAPITLKAYPGELPVIDGQNKIPTGEWGRLVYITAPYNVIDGFEIKNSAWFGLTTAAPYSVVRNCNVHHSQDVALHLAGDNQLAEGNRVWQSNQKVYTHGFGGWGVGLSVSREIGGNGLAENSIARRNVVYQNWGEGLNVHEAIGVVVEDNTSSDNFSLDLYVSNAKNVVVRRNIVYSTAYSMQYPWGSGTNTPFIFPCNNASSDPGSKCRGGPGAGISITNEIGPTASNPSGKNTYGAVIPQIDNITVVNNVVLGTSAPLDTWGQTSYGGTTNFTNMLIANNTFVNGVIGKGVGSINFRSGTYTGSRFTNNIVVQDSNSLPVITTGTITNLAVDHNLWSKPPVAVMASSTDVIGNPLLAKTGSVAPPSGEYFRILPNSPAIGKGATVATVVDDFFRIPRTTPYDIGAYETVAVVTPTPTPTPTPVPVPVDPSNVAYGKTVTTSSIESTGLVGKNATDGVLNTRWGSLFADPQWVVVDLGKIYNLTKVKLDWETASAKAYKIQVSVDNINWVDLYSTTTSPGGTENITVNGAGRYVKIYGTQRNTSWGYSLWEISVYGTLYPCI